MRALLAIGAAMIVAVTLPASPAAADDGPRFGIVWGGSTFNGVSGRHDRRRDRGTDTVFVYDRDYQGDSAWRAESFNDWWHERPNRSYPSWVLRNQDCQRTWWDGAVLRC